MASIPTKTIANLIEQTKANDDDYFIIGGNDAKKISFKNLEAQLNSSLKPLIITKKFVLDNQIIEANSNKVFILKDTIINGYNRINNRVNIENASSSGTLSSLCNCYNSKAAGNDTQIIIRNNHATSQAKILIEATIIYIKSDFVQDL